MPDDASISIASFDELMQHEDEIVRRVNAKPNGPLLLATDPLRLLGDVGVHLDEAAVAGWRAHGGEMLDGARSRLFYDAVAASGAAGDVQFTLQRLVQRQ